MLEVHWSNVVKLLTNSFIYLASPGFLTGMPQQREPVTAVSWRPDNNTGNSVPFSLRIVCGFFNVPQLFFFSYDKGCEMGPPACSPYPRRLESLTICWCNYKGSTFYSVNLRPWVLFWLESNSRPPAWQLDTQPTGLWSIKFIPILLGSCKDARWSCQNLAWSGFQSQKSKR